MRWSADFGSSINFGTILWTRFLVFVLRSALYVIDGCVVVPYAVIVWLALRAIAGFVGSM